MFSGNERALRANIKGLVESISETVTDQKSILTLNGHLHVAGIVPGLYISDMQKEKLQMTDGFQERSSRLLEDFKYCP